MAEKLLEEATVGAFVRWDGANAPAWATITDCESDGRPVACTSTTVEICDLRINLLSAGRHGPSRAPHFMDS